MTLPTTRPSDELTAKMIAKQHDLNVSLLVPDRCDKSDCSWFDYNNTERSEYDQYTDPRDCTDTALELLAHLNRKYDVETEIDYIYKTYSSMWAITIRTGNEDVGYRDNVQHIPISGPPFCYAVVHLAAKVLGEGEG